MNAPPPAASSSSNVDRGIPMPAPSEPAAEAGEAAEAAATAGAAHAADAARVAQLAKAGEADAYAAEPDGADAAQAQALALAQAQAEAEADAIAASLGTHASDIGDAMLIDVRRAATYQQATTVLPGAIWRDPSQLADWCQTLPTSRAIVVYCVHGHEVGRNAATQLAARGFSVRFLLGGIEGWQQAGLPLQRKPTG